jgi:hypothetical protein
MTKYEYESGRLAGVEWGTHLERRRIFDLLFKLGVIRDNMVGHEWLVIYTQDGPLDINRDFLNETETKEESSGDK